jgi:hypothetical protein
MPLIPPPPGASPALSRRGLIAAAAGLAAATLSPAAAAMPQPTQSPDAKLTALGAQFEQGLVAQQQAWQHLQDCEERYLQEGPVPPEALTGVGPLGTLLDRGDSWWNARELRWLLRTERRRSVQREARALLKVALAYEARDRRFQRKIGVREAECAHRAASRALDDLGRVILLTPANSTCGLAVKARAVKAWGKPDWWSTEDSHADTYERIAAEVLDAVSASAA